MQSRPRVDQPVGVYPKHTDRNIPGYLRANLTMDSGNLVYNLITEEVLPTFNLEVLDSTATVATSDGALGSREVEVGGEVEVQFGGAIGLDDKTNYYYKEVFRAIPHFVGKSNLIMSRTFLDELHGPPPALLFALNVKEMLVTNYA